MFLNLGDVDVQTSKSGEARLRLGEHKVVNLTDRFLAFQSQKFLGRAKVPFQRYDTECARDAGR